MHHQLKEKLIMQDCANLSQLTTKAIRVEQCVLESNQRKIQTGVGDIQVVSSLDSESGDSSNEEMTTK